jgi:hypothetical protein
LLSRQEFISTRPAGRSSAFQHFSFRTRKSPERSK